MRLDARNGLFIVLFIAAALVAMQINLSPLVGKGGQYFTGFQLFGPVAGAFLGFFGIITVLVAQALNFVVLGHAVTLLDVLRIAPMLFAVYFFMHKKNRVVMIVVPAIAMLLYWLNPVGREAWPFALLWTIPIIAAFFPSSLLWKSFGATFTAHAVGGIIWLYTVPMTSGQWVALIPQVMMERTFFALGIAGSYVLTNALLVRVTANWKVPFLRLEKKAQRQE